VPYDSFIDIDGSVVSKMSSFVKQQISKEDLAISTLYQVQKKIS